MRGHCVTFLPCKLSPSALSPGPGRLGEASQAEHCSAETCAHPREPPRPLRESRASSRGPRAGPAGRWHCRHGEPSRRAPPLPAANEAKTALLFVFPILPSRPRWKSILLVPCDRCILAALQHFLHTAQNSLLRKEAVGTQGMVGSSRHIPVSIRAKRDGGKKSLRPALKQGRHSFPNTGFVISDLAWNPPEHEYFNCSLLWIHNHPKLPWELFFQFKQRRCASIINFSRL